MTVADRVLAYLAERSVYDSSTGCWLWSRSCNSSGYPKAYFDGKQWLAHRLGYIHLVEEPPPWAVIHHTCTTGKICVRPDHMQATTNLDNVAEMHERVWYQRRIAELEAEVERLLALVTQDARSTA